MALIEGTFGSDNLFGTPGNDVIDGFGDGLNTGQVDFLTGGAGADIFVLGDPLVSPFPYYADEFWFSPDGRASYAVITDFSFAEFDTIEVVGSTLDYDVTQISQGNVEISYQGDLIAIVSGFNVTAADVVSSLVPV
ncbi:MAG: hypothetical protein ACFBSE_22335 [Prochloraceae cyanobacterium]